MTWKYNSSSAKHYSILPLYIRTYAENLRIIIWTSVTHTGIYHNFYFIGHAPMYPQMQVKLVRSPDRGQLKARTIRHCISPCDTGSSSGKASGWFFRHEMSDLFHWPCTHVSTNAGEACKISRQRTIKSKNN